MQLLTDLLRPYLAQKTFSREHYEHVHAHGNAAINTRRTDWFEFVAGLTAERTSLPLEQVQEDFTNRVPFSDTIRYLHLGNPETILVDDESTLEHLSTELEWVEPTEEDVIAGLAPGRAGTAAS